jgi:hypothetical protein
METAASRSFCFAGVMTAAFDSKPFHQRDVANTLHIPPSTNRPGKSSATPPSREYSSKHSPVRGSSTRLMIDLPRALNSSLLSRVL